MDFLDPRKRRAHNIRLIIGYVLVAIAIGMATIILGYATNGFGINTKTGQVIENGLLFVGSKPNGAEIYLNGHDNHTKTPARLIIPTGDYTLTLKKSGYRDWSRSFTLEASSVDRFVYPFLFPITPRVTPMASFSAQPAIFTESPDQHWLLIEKTDTANVVSFDRYDTTNLSKAPATVSIPAGILSGGEGGKANLSVVGWSTDNNNVLLKHTYSGGTEYIVFDHNNPAASFNVNKTFKVNPDQVALFNKKATQLYIYDAKAQTVSLGTVASGKLSTPVLSHVLAFKPYGTNLITYVTDANTAKGQVQARIWDNGPTYPLYSFPAGKVYLIGAAQYAGHFYYYAGDDAAGKINIYEDPLSDIQNNQIGHAIPTIALDVPGANKASFSNNTRFIEVDNSQSFGVYDMETQQDYRYRLQVPLVAPLTWMDGNRLIGDSADQVFVTDSDSTNQQTLVPTIDATGGLFSQDYNHLFTFQEDKTGKTVNLVNVDMRAGADLPADPNK